MFYFQQIPFLKGYRVPMLFKTCCEVPGIPSSVRHFLNSPLVGNVSKNIEFNVLGAVTEVCLKVYGNTNKFA